MYININITAPLVNSTIGGNATNGEEADYSGVSLAIKLADYISLSFYALFLVLSLICAIIIRFQLWSADTRQFKNMKKRQKSINCCLVNKIAVKHSSTCFVTDSGSIKAEFESNDEKTNMSSTEDPAFDDLQSSTLICPICLEIFKPGEEVLISKASECRHIFHEKCLSQWLNLHDECPCCRMSYLKQSERGLESILGDSFCTTHGIERREKKIDGLTINCNAGKYDICEGTHLDEELGENLEPENN